MYETSGVSVTWLLSFELFIPTNDSRSLKSALSGLVLQVRGLKRACQLRIVERNQSPLLQLPGKSGKPESAQGKWGQEIHPAQMKSIAIKCRLDEPNHICYSHYQYQQNQDRELLRTRFGSARQQRQKRKREL